MEQFTKYASVVASLISGRVRALACLVRQVSGSLLWCLISAVGPTQLTMNIRCPHPVVSLTLVYLIVDVGLLPLGVSLHREHLGSGYQASLSGHQPLRDLPDHYPRAASVGQGSLTCLPCSAHQPGPAGREALAGDRRHVSPSGRRPLPGVLDTSCQASSHVRGTLHCTACRAYKASTSVRKALPAVVDTEIDIVLIPHRAGKVRESMLWWCINFEKGR